LKRLIPICLVLLGAGCGPTVAEVCEDLASCPDPVGHDCEADGETLEERADGGCEDEFSSYLDCLHESRCAWRTECEAQRDTVRECVGSLPD
jgi:hypothetical protein